jgi:anhydro-N-acetylmuramic acid kinase
MSGRALPLPALVRDPAVVIGLMSGTSADGVDAALCRIESVAWEPGGERRLRCELLAAHTVPYPDELRERVHRADKLDTPALASLNIELGERFAAAAIQLCRAADVALETVDLVGSHGQTVWHDPRGRHGPGPATLQLAEPAVIAARTTRNVVADFRPADLALGGEGAPLVPYVDYLLLAGAESDRAVLNLGGIANVTWLPRGADPSDVLAFDTGPGNLVLDGLVRWFGLAAEGYDPEGKLAAAGAVHDALLQELLGEPFFALAPPRSTGRELFGEGFVGRLVKRGQELGLGPPDLLATAAALTCRSVADALHRFCGSPDEILLCGGGRKNRVLRDGLKALLPETRLRDTDEEGVDGDAKEAIAFAVLAFLAARGVSNHLPHVTGAGRATILGKFVWGAEP